METGKMKESGTTRGRKKELHCPECGGIVARAGKGTNAVFRCPKCKRDVDVVKGSLENSRFLTEKERDKYFPEHVYEDLANVKQFAAMTARYDKLKINLISDLYTIDAHSLIGIISLDITSPLILEIPEDVETPDEFFEDIKPFLYDESREAV